VHLAGEELSLSAQPFLAALGAASKVHFLARDTFYRGIRGGCADRSA
jgi:hypothetical protein